MVDRENPPESSRDIDRRELRGHITKLTWPALAEQLLSTLFGMVDMVMVGNLSTVSLVAVGLSNHPTKLILAVFRALNIGTTALVARHMGTSDRETSVKILAQTLIVTVIIGIMSTAFGLVYAEKVMIFMGAKPEVIPLATKYFKITTLGYIFVTISLGVGAALRGAGDTVTPMRFNVVSNMMNVVLNYFLIYGKMGFPAMGVAGAAIATIASQFLGMVMALMAVFNPSSILSVSVKKDFMLNTDIMRRIFRIGLPSGLEQMAFRTGQIEFIRSVAGLGTEVYAAHQIAVNVFSLSFAPSMAFSIAATTLVGQSLGAGEPELAEKYGLETRRMGMIVAVSIASTFFFFGPQIAGIYGDNPQVIAMAAMCLRIVAAMQPMQSTHYILSGALRGAGDTRGPLISSFIAIWGIRVILAKVFISMGLGLMGAWIAQFCDQAFRATFIYFRYNMGKWKKISV